MKLSILKGGTQKQYAIFRPLPKHSVLLAIPILELTK